MSQLLNDWDFNWRKRRGDVKYFLCAGYLFITLVFGVFQQGQFFLWIYDTIMWANFGKPEFKQQWKEEKE